MVDTEVGQDEMSFLVSITGNLGAICAKALQEINLQDSDYPAAALVVKYAQEIDKGNLATLAKVGPLLLNVMESLQMTPRARAVAAKGQGNAKSSSAKIDELRQRRAERQSRTKNIHTAS
jgi:hypothetical protein